MSSSSARVCSIPDERVHDIDLSKDAPMPPTVASVRPRFRPYASPNHQVTEGRYITNNDPRGHILVYEYPLNGKWIMMDIDNGYILWTGIWKALGNSKADMVKLIDSQPDLAPLIRRVRGGYLKIQGTWMSYPLALRLARRPTFPSTCLSPDQPGYGQVVASGSGRRRFRKANNAPTSVAVPRDLPPLTRRPSDPYSYGEGPSSHRMPADSRLDLGGPSSPPNTGDASPSKDRSLSRYSPYHGSLSSHLGRRPSSSGRSLHRDIPPLSLHDNPHPEPPNSAAEHTILPPMRQHNPTDDSVTSSYALPPISALEDLRGVHANDSTAVLRRLKEDDESYAEYTRHEEEQTWRRHRSLSAPPYK
ncbi:hypothetical protein ONZ45_g8836 [Pleurotus djamor]|nr:hypothetical protein ONZ45_g8836 [Pleurotus djamor]